MSSPFYIEPKDVDDGLVRTFEYFFKTGETAQRDSRNGPVLEVPNISIVKWNQGTPFVSMDPVRDANCFFALAESVWMAEGRNDLPFLLHFNSAFGQYSDDGKEVRGSAYGKRWRDWFLDDEGHVLDQIPRLVEELAQDPNSRRGVLLMWDAVDLNLNSKDVPCNTQVYFLVRDGRLDMTVTNRSNDVTYGLFGSNVVHFHFLMAYVSMLVRRRMSELGKSQVIEPGDYYQVTNNLHVYVDFPITMKIREDINGRINRPSGLPSRPALSMSGSLPSVYEDVEAFDADCKFFCDNYTHVSGGWARSAFGKETLDPMLTAWNLRKAGKLEEALAVLAPRSSAWCQSGAAWLRRRIKARDLKELKSSSEIAESLDSHAAALALSIDK